MVLLPSINEMKAFIGMPTRKESFAVTEMRQRVNSYYHHIVEKDPDRQRLLIGLAIVYIIVLLVQSKRFYWWYPTFNISLGIGIPYPDSRKEFDSIVMNEYILKRMPSDISFFRMTDLNPARAFEAIITPEEMPISEMSRIMTGSRVITITYFFKWLYNRGRPAQVAPEIINLEKETLLLSESANTPSYPSGHALQAYYLAKLLSRKFPAKTKAIMDMAIKCANIRIMAGLHYPSDRDFAWWIVDNYLLDL